MKDAVPINNISTYPLKVGKAHKICFKPVIIIENIPDKPGEWIDRHNKYEKDCGKQHKPHGNVPPIPAFL